MEVGEEEEVEDVAVKGLLLDERYYGMNGLSQPLQPCHGRPFPRDSVDISQSW